MKRPSFPDFPFPPMNTDMLDASAASAASTIMGVITGFMLGSMGQEEKQLPSTTAPTSNNPYRNQHAQVTVQAMEDWLIQQPPSRSREQMLRFLASREPQEQLTPDLAATLKRLSA